MAVNEDREKKTYNVAGDGIKNPIYYDGKIYEAPDASWTSEAPAEWRNTPERLEQMWFMGNGGAGWKSALENYANMTPLEQAVFDNANKRQAEYAASVGGVGGESYSSGSNRGYDNGYAGQIKALTDKIMNYGPFSYNAADDPLYQQYSDQYTRLGKRAMDDTLAKVSARTGGLASSYAASAGNQAYGNYMQQLSNKIPELYKLAYDMYNDDYNRDLNRLNLLRGLDSDAYGRFASERAYGDSRADLAYNRALDAENLAYNRAWNEEARDYGRNQDADKRAVYAFSDDGGVPYRISSPAGLNYLNTLPEGDSAIGGDGSTWKRENGQIVITDASGRTYRYGEATPTAPTWYGNPLLDDDGGDGGSSTGIDSGAFNNTLNRIQQNFDRNKRSEAILIAQGAWNTLSPSQQDEITKILNDNGVT